MTDPLDDIELWKKHTDGDANAEKALRKYRKWKRENSDGGGRLYLSNCGLQSLPREIGRLTFLKYLYCSKNELRELPSEIGGLTSLIYLSCSENELRELPPEIGGLTSLKELYCSKNEFGEGSPTTIEALKERWLIYQRRCIKGAKA